MSSSPEDYPLTPEGSMDARLWRGRHIGDDMAYAEEVAKRLGGDAIVVKYGQFKWGVYQPKFKPIEQASEAEDGSVSFELRQVEGEWLMVMCVFDGAHRTELPLSRGDLDTMVSDTLPEALALLDSLRLPASPKPHGQHNKRPAKNFVG